MDEPVNTRRFEGARLQAAAFPDDTGEQSPEVAAALAAYAAGTGAHAAVLAALSTSRLLVPVVALLGEVEHDERGLAVGRLFEDKATVGARDRHLVDPRAAAHADRGARHGAAGLIPDDARPARLDERQRKGKTQ